MNKVILIGRLVRDSETRYTSNNMMVLRNAVAVDRRTKQDGQPTADFINITAFGKTAEFISNYFSKGKRLAITGRIQTGSYDNADGKKVYTTDVIVEEVEFVESKKSEGEQASMSKPAYQASPDTGRYEPEMPVGDSSGGYFPIDDDGEIPF